MSGGAQIDRCILGSIANRTGPYMKSFSAHPFESLLVWATALMTLAGFWNLYFGHGSGANPYHHLHFATVSLWLALLLVQLALIGNRPSSMHRKVGLCVLLAAPLLVASAALLSVESARKGVASGRGDFMVVQNVMGTLQLALIIVLAFALRRRRQLHAAFIVSTALLFMAIAMFFSLVGFVPGFRVEGPETFYRFGKALATVQYAIIAVGALFFAKDPRHGWPFLLVGVSFSANELLKAWLTRRGLLEPLTELVGSLNQPLVFAGGFVAILVLLVATGVWKTGRAGNPLKPDPLRAG